MKPHQSIIDPLRQQSREVFKDAQAAFVSQAGSTQSVVESSSIIDRECMVQLRKEAAGSG